MVFGQIYLISVSHSSLLRKMGWYPFWGIVININRINGKECPLLEAHQLELQEEAVRSHQSPTIHIFASGPLSWLPGGSGYWQGGGRSPWIPSGGRTPPLWQALAMRPFRGWPRGLRVQHTNLRQKTPKGRREGREGEKEHSSGESNLLSYLTTICLGPKNWWIQV